MGRINRLLSLIQHKPQAVPIRYCGNVSTEPLPSNDGGIFTEQLPSNIKGIFTVPLPNKERGIHIQTHGLIRGIF
jgi:hypothetical protein